MGDGSFRKEAEELGKVTTTPYEKRDEYEKLLGEADVVFASSYLSMLSVMAAKKPVIAVYTNPLKKDYLTLSPFGKFISVVDSADKVVAEVKNLQKTRALSDLAYAWVKDQTWDKVLGIYLKLWKI